MADSAEKKDEKVTTPDAPKADAPPWGDDFDAEKAWRLIVNLRSDVAGLKTDRDDARTALQAREDAEKSDAEKAVARAERAEADLKEERRKGLVSAAALKHNLPDDVLEFLTGDDAEAIEAKAARLGALSKVETTEEPGEEIPGKPKAALRPGHGGEETPAFDPNAIAEAARASF